MFFWPLKQTFSLNQGKHLLFNIEQRAGLSTDGSRQAAGSILPTTP
jgi:hypothetical protein